MISFDRKPASPPYAAADASTPLPCHPARQLQARLARKHNEMRQNLRPIVIQSARWGNGSLGAIPRSAFMLPRPYTSSYMSLVDRT